ncbi:hypothetical protein BK127_38700 [Paenibacillus sp. FSL H7-0331]|nr:hypothetical protein BK127_38700 [Paenibacillus sp. FSL H7-0331]
MNNPVASYQMRTEYDQLVSELAARKIPYEQIEFYNYPNFIAQEQRDPAYNVEIRDIFSTEARMFIPPIAKLSNLRPDIHKNVPVFPPLKLLHEGTSLKWLERVNPQAHLFRWVCRHLILIQRIKNAIKKHSGTYCRCRPKRNRYGRIIFMFSLNVGSQHHYYIESRLNCGFF